MLLARAPEPWVAPALIAGTVVFFGVLGWGALKFYRKYEFWTANSLARCFHGLDISYEPRPGDVELVYHTYSGFIAWATHREWHVFATPEDALELLQRLYRFNIKWGMLTYEAIFIPFLAIGNYWSQKRSIARQVAAMNDT